MYSRILEMLWQYEDQRYQLYNLSQTQYLSLLSNWMIITCFDIMFN